MTVIQESKLKEIVKINLFRQYKYINTQIWQASQLHRMIMNRIGLVGVTGSVELLFKRDIEKQVRFHMAQYRHSRVNALCTLYCKGKKRDKYI